ncbi:MAG: hypothetical protein QXD43_03840 [Candidatus Aenigmatarchaeota archaeon]
MKKLLFSILLSMLILMQITFAADFSIEIDKGPDYPFYASKTDFIKLKINNPLPEDWFTISVIGVPIEWVTTETSILRVPTGSSITNLIVKPSRDAIPNIYQYFLKITRVSSKEEVEKTLLLNIVQVTSAILKDISLSCETCLDTVEVSGKIINVGSKPLDLSLVFKYADQQKTVNIGKLDVNEKMDFKTNLDLKNLEPNSYDIEINLIDINGNLLYTEFASFKIPVIENVIYDKKVSSTPFGSLILVTATNKGNIVSEADLKSVSPQNWYSIISAPTPTGMMTGYYVWKTSLRPGESKSISYSEIYWPTYVFIIAVVLAIAFIYWQSTAFSFSKNVIGKPTFKANKDISISLHLKSKKRGISKVAIRDVVPPHFSIVSKFETVKPLIRKVANGIELIWKLGDLKPNEERVLHYTIRPAIEVSKKISLPSALAKASSGKGLAIKRSNKVTLHPEKGETKVVTVKVS